MLSIEEAPDAADLAVRLRGDPHRFGPVAPRSGIAILGGPSLVPEGGGRGRRELADWWTDPRHPLTARVHVNRVFARLFGVGLAERQCLYADLVVWLFGMDLAGCQWT